MTVQRARRGHGAIAGQGRLDLLPKATAAKVARLVAQICTAKRLNESQAAEQIGVVRSVLYKLQHEHKLSEEVLSKIKAWAAATARKGGAL